MATMLAVLIKKTVTVSAVAAIWKPCLKEITHEDLSHVDDIY